MERGNWEDYKLLFGEENRAEETGRGNIWSWD